MTSLFPDTETLSPKLTWLQKHRLRTRQESLPRWNSGPRDSEPWVCENAGGTRRATGSNEADAIWAYARAYGITHYMEMEWMGAMT
jgi:hypothetical protein